MRAVTCADMAPGCSASILPGALPPLGRGGTATDATGGRISLPLEVTLPAASPSGTSAAPGRFGLAASTSAGRHRLLTAPSSASCALPSLLRSSARKEADRQAWPMSTPDKIRCVSTIAPLHSRAPLIGFHWYCTPTERFTNATSWAHLAAQAPRVRTAAAWQVCAALACPARPVLGCPSARLFARSGQHPRSVQPRCSSVPAPLQDPAGVRHPLQSPQGDSPLVDHPVASVRECWPLQSYNVEVLKNYPMMWKDLQSTLHVAGCWMFKKHLN